VFPVLRGRPYDRSGVRSAMLPYTVIEDANPPQFGDTAIGVVNFLNFTFSALLGPVFGWLLQHVSGGFEAMEKIVFLRKTGLATRVSSSRTAQEVQG
jgi:hypothetical protein